jgi:alpha-N-acetylglucosaminidase
MSKHFLMLITLFFGTLVVKANHLQRLQKNSQAKVYEKTTDKSDQGGQDNEYKTVAAQQLIKRLFPGYSDKFVLQLTNKTDPVDFFEIEQGNNRKVIVKGNSAISLGSGVNYYLKHVAKCHFSWNGDQLILPKELPFVGNKIRKVSPYKDNFNFNYCTFNYTMAWWDWKRWEREIDFMAINGINMPLAVVGMEGVWYNFLKRFNYSDQEAKAFIAGPGYTAWWLMGNLEGRGGPVTSDWIDSRIALQQKILKRMRELGMRPALPGFVGLVPRLLQNKYPTVQLLDQGKWLNDDRPAVLHPDTPLFREMAAAWYQEVDKLYGRIDVFTGDLFHEGGNSQGINVGNLATEVQKNMLDYNSKAIWVIQGWGGNPTASFLSNLKRDHVLIVELCGEFFRNWEGANGFENKPWVFSTIIQYGGNTGLHGRLGALSKNITAALKIKNPPIGLGTTWESIEVNPVVNDFLADMRWETKMPNLKKWTREYAERRYGFASSNISKAWKIILNTAYGTYEKHRRPTESVFCARPSLNIIKVSPFEASIEVHYDQRKFRDAVKKMLCEAEKGNKSATFKYDIVDFTRQFIANTAQITYKEMVTAFKIKNKKAFEKAAAEFLEMLDDQDRLLGTESLFLLGKWINDARNCTTNEQQVRQNESNARILITTWTKEKSGLRDYAWREWNGLLKTYYKPRWEFFIADLRSQLEGADSGKTDYFELDSAWASQTWEQQKYPITPVGNQLEIANELITKWSTIIDDAKRYTPPKITVIKQAESAEKAR